MKLHLRPSDDRDGVAIVGGLGATRPTGLRGLVAPVLATLLAASSTALVAVPIVVPLVAVPATASALDSEEALTSAQGQISAVSAGVGGIKAAVSSSKSQRTPEQLIADADLLMNSKDYDRAAALLNQIIEKFPDNPTAIPDAMSLLGETYFRSNQMWSAKRVFKKIVESTDPRYAVYQPKALARLVDVAMRKRDDQTLEEVLAYIDKAPAGATSLVAYARGKALLAKKDFTAAKSVLSSIDDKSDYVHQARYMLALIAVKEATPAAVVVPEGEDPPAIPPQRYAAAIDLFNKVTQLPADTVAHKQVIDDAWLAIGRLFYETDQLAQAIQAYNHIGRDSTEFGTMLYELAWTYVKLGDADRALRSLEVLAIADPKGENVADGTLLRGDLMLRAGKFDKALTTYEGFKATYDPMRQQVEDFLGATSDPGVYYDKLVHREFEAMEGKGLPPIAIEWARNEEDGQAAFAVIDDVQECRELLSKSNDMIERLSAVLNSPARVRAFPELKAAEEHALGLINKIAVARMTVAEGAEDVDDSALSGEIGQARAERRSLEERMKKLPVSDSDFSAREAEAQKQWNSVSQAVQRLELEVNTNQAIVNGLTRVLNDGESMGVVRDPASIEQFKQTIAQEQAQIEADKAIIVQLRKAIGSGKAQAGFGDQRFVEDEQVRNQYKAALFREMTLASNGAAGNDLAAYGRRALVVLQAADAAELDVMNAKKDVDDEVERRTTGVETDVAREKSALEGYEVQLNELDQKSRNVVGEVAMRNFGLVRDRLKNLVLRADVGITQQAWEVREDQITRVRTLQRERNREEKVLREELNEVLDDAGETPPEEPKK